MSSDGELETKAAINDLASDVVKTEADNVTVESLPDDEVKQVEVEDEEEEQQDEDEVEEDQDGQDEDEDEEDEEEDEDDDEVQHRRKKPRRERRNQFLDVEAEVDDDEEDEEDEDGLEQEGFIQDQEDDAEEADAHDDRLHREVDRRREAIAEQDAEKLASELKERYGRATAGKYRDDSGVVPQRLLLPSVQDPNIWGVRCRPGRERELIRSILKKKENLQYTKTPLEIYSAFQRDSFGGYIYVEARKQSAVLHALQGLTSVFPRNMIMVPIKEYADLLRVNKSTSREPTPGDYVRIKRGKYQGDLAVVVNISENGLDARLKVVPRLDYGRTAVINTAELGTQEDELAGTKRKRVGGSSNKTRPPPRLFSLSEATQHDPRGVQSRGPSGFVYLGDDYQNGFLMKDFRVAFLQTENVQPRLEELTRFNAGDDGNAGIDLSAVSQSLKDATADTQFEPGEDITVISGEQAGMEGRVMATSHNVVTIVGAAGPLKGHQLSVPAATLRKRFSVGDHVRVTRGAYADDAGLIVQVEKEQVTFLSDLSRTELTVFARDLQRAEESGGVTEIGKYELRDLVRLDPYTVGVIVRLERDSVGVLIGDGSVRSVKTASITMKLAKGDEFATDRQGRELHVGDSVKEISGERRQGAIVHMYRSVLFCHSRDLQENIGVFAAKTGSVASVGSKALERPAAGADLERMNPAIRKMVPPPGAPQARASFGRDKVIGQMVTIGRGSQHKGLSGMVKDANDTIARVELDARNKIISVDKTKLLIHDKRTGAKVPYFEFISNRPGPGFGMPPGPGGNGGFTPGPGGGFTPGGANLVNRNLGGSRTPAWAAAGGGRTPAWGNGGRTPAVGAAGGRTPALGAYGGRTPGWAEGGGRTPAWGNSGRTPAWGNGGRTPAWDAARSGASVDSAPTPGAFYGSSDYMGAPTPGAVGAPTPAAMGAPTPAAMSAPTPGPISAPTPGLMSAPTPGPMNAPTPGIMSAPTPAPFHDDPEDMRTPGPISAPTPGVWAGRRDDEDEDDDDDVKYEPASP